MLNKAQAIPTIINKLKKLPPGHYIDIRTYKRNRSVVIVKTHESQLLIIENGYEKQQVMVSWASIKKTLQKLFKKEFPRSNTIRLYSMGEFNPQKLEKTNLKIL
jgi:hypothetical protein